MSDNQKVNSFLKSRGQTPTAYANMHNELNINSLRGTFNGKTPIKKVVKFIKENDMELFDVLPENAKALVK
jgi:hypothetical protein